MRGLQMELHAARKDNGELRDLAVFLDDDRRKARAAFEQWRDFGRFKAQSMDQAVRMK